MGFIRTLKEKRQTQKQADVRQQAEDTIRLADFEKNIYIAYNGTPLIAVEDSWTSKDILQELDKIRQNFINARK